MDIVKIKVADLIEYENNPRFNEEAVEPVAESIKQFGFKVPIIVDKNNVIITGHTRKKAAELLQMEEVPCIVADDLTPEKIQAFRLVDNKTAEFAQWDMDKLNEELSQLTAFDIDMNSFGFDFDFEMDLDKETEEDNFDVETALEEIEEPKSKLGDVYQLGNHRLMCGDSTQKEDVMHLMNNQEADMLLTDPPYNMDYCGKGFIKERSENVRKRIEHIIDFDPNTIKFIKDLNIGSYYFFTSKDLIYEYISIFKEYNFNLLFWGKSNPTPFVNNCFLPDVEYLLYFHNGNRVWNNGLPFEIYKKYYVSSKLEGRKDAGNLHPTMKPVQMLSDKIKISSNKNGIVLDLFGGSGSTLIACEQLDRTCYMMEYDPKYCDVIIKRWEEYTGKKAEQIV